MGTLGAFAQLEVGELPIHYGQYFNNPQLNPAKNGSDANAEFFAASKRNIGNFGTIANTFFSTAFRISKNNNGFNAFGLYFNNDKEGQVIRRNRFYGTFARHQKLNKNWVLSAGLALGAYQFSTKLNAITGGLSAIAFDGSGGVYLYSQNTRLGLSVNQFNNVKVQPFQQIIRLNRHFHFIGEHNVVVNDYFHITPSAFVRYIQTDSLTGHLNALHYGGGINCLLKQAFSCGGTYEPNEGAYFFVGLKNINLSVGEGKKTSSNQLNLQFAYFVPSLINTRTNIQSFELVLSYFIKDAKNDWW